jgi:methylated-DNA-[protein]-cysteine S-methyltransferase
LTCVWLPEGRGTAPDVPIHETRVLARTAKQLREYFAGTRTTFDVPLGPEGTEFQRGVWKTLEAIPYGETWSYGDVARRIGQPSASRAVGAANGRNPIAIIVPCHRVIGSSGALTGYGGGMPTKKWLLGHEQKHARRGQARLPL